MAISNSKLLRLSEKELKDNVLIPLFKKMGFQDVFSHHGGPLEQGKDIVMWKTDNLGCRENYAVVVKSKKITGKVTGSNSAGEVRLQVEQCFSTHYIDPVDHKSRDVDHCFIVCPHEIKKEFRSAISGPLEKTNLNKLIRYIYGDGLLEIIQRYCPELSVIEKLEEVRQVLNKVNPNYMIVASVEKNGLKFGIKPKHSDAGKVEPLKFSVQLELPETQEGKNVLDSLKKHISTGSPVTLTKQYIKKLEYPNFIKQVIDPTGERINKIEFGPITSPEPFLAEIQFESDDGKKLILNYIDFKRVQVGKDEITLDNSHQPVPWHIKAIFNSKNKRIKITYNFKYANFNVIRVLEGLKFQRSLANGGFHTIKHLDTGSTINKSYIQKGIFPDTDDLWINLLEKLVFIQEKTFTHLVIPPNDISSDQINKILKAARILETGKLVVKGKALSINMDKKNAETLLCNYDKVEREAATFKVEDSIPILGVHIKMGPVSFTISKLLILDKDRDRLRCELASPEKKETYKLDFQIDKEEEIEMTYHNWHTSVNQK